MEGEYELVCDLSNGAISNDLERTLTLFSRSHHFLTLNISQTATYEHGYLPDGRSTDRTDYIHTAIVTIEGE